MRALVAQIDPQPAGLGLAVAGRQHGHRRVVGMDHACPPSRARRSARRAGAAATPPCPSSRPACCDRDRGRRARRSRPGDRAGRWSAYFDMITCARTLAPAMRARDRHRRHGRLRHRLALGARVGRPHMAHHLEAAGHVLQDLGHVLADLAQALGAAARAQRRRPARASPRGAANARAACGAASSRAMRPAQDHRLRGLGHVRRSPAVALDLLELQLQLLDLALDALRRLAERHPLQPRQLELQLLGFQRLGDETDLPRSSASRIGQRALRASASSTVDRARSAAAAACRTQVTSSRSPAIPRPSAATCVEEFASRCLPATSTAAPASA